MSIPHCLTNAHDFNIGNFTFVNTSSSTPEQSGPFQYLYKNIAIGAAHNSEERHDAPACHEDTRKAVQEEIHSWITDGDGDDEPKTILSLMGPAGAGKTAIVGSVADACDELGLLAGSFFFASYAPSEARRSKRLLVTTLIYHLISSLEEDHPLRRAVLTAIQRDPSIFRKKLKDQFRLLLIKPLASTRHLFDVSTLPKVFIIDGLDEVEAGNSRQHGRDAHEVRLENDADQEEILSALLYIAKSNAFPFRIIIASRPERVITTFFSGPADGATRRIFLDEKYDPDSDIRLFFQAKFSEIRWRYRLPASWPSENEVQRLVENASGQFIYAATVVRFLHSGKHPDPQSVLEAVLSSRCGEIGALAPLDALYTRILLMSPDVDLALRWIYVILQWEKPSLFLNALLQDYPGQAEHLLENLTSLLWIPPIEGQPAAYRLYHKSFSEFLRDGRRCGEELSIAFGAGVHFFCARTARVFKEKMPVVPLPAPQQELFIDECALCPYVSLFVNDTGNTEPSMQDVLVKCDVVWWFHRSLASNARKRGHKDTILHAVPIGYWFPSIHFACSSSGCLPVCMHWRSNILRTCKELGWSVPNVVALFRETFSECCYLKVSPFFSQYFVPPDQQPNRGNVQLPATDTQYTVDVEYQKMLDLVGAMHSRLPPDWASRYKVAYEHDRYAQYRGFSSIIEEIRQELGIEEPDMILYADTAVYPPL